MHTIPNIGDTYAIIENLKAVKLSQEQAEALTKMHVQLIASQTEQLEQYQAQFVTKADIHHLEERINNSINLLKKDIMLFIGSAISTAVVIMLGFIRYLSK